MNHTLATPVKGATTLRVHQVTFDEDARVFFIRGVYGSMEGEVFVRDTDLAPVTITAEDETYQALADVLNPVFAAAFAELEF